MMWRHHDHKPLTRMGFDFTVRYYPNLSLPVVARKGRDLQMFNLLWTTGEANSWWEDRFCLDRAELHLVRAEIVHLVEVVDYQAWPVGAIKSEPRQRRVFTLTPRFVDWVWRSWGEL